MTDFDALCDFTERHPQLLVLTGAGVSTRSGISDYRDGNGQWKRRPPMDIQSFRSSAANRARYWARSMAGWPTIAAARPNRAHYALSMLQRTGRLAGLVTQNVDGLHESAGHVDVVALHGRLSDVVCLDCGARSSRDAWQKWLVAHNSERTVAGPSAPDGDADIEPRNLDAFRVPACIECGGVLKPDVVFFGETVPKARVERCYELLAAADALLVVGSSLMVYSGYRFCRAACASSTPVAVINLGRTRADDLVALKVEADCGVALEAMAGIGPN